MQLDEYCFFYDSPNINLFGIIVDFKGRFVYPINTFPTYNTPDRYELRSSLEGGVNKVSVRLDNEPVPTGQRAIGARLVLSPLGNRHYCNQG